jgi:asparagine N-glycosylation enzyme membrane subunit Stt3
MEALRQTQRRYATTALTLAIIVGLLFILMGQKPIGKGLLLGTIFSVINFILIGETIPLRAGKSRGTTFFISLGSIGLRYLLLAIPLVVAVKFKQFNLLASILGIFMIQFVILGDYLLKIKPSIRRKQI